LKLSISSILAKNATAVAQTGQFRSSLPNRSQHLVQLPESGRGPGSRDPVHWADSPWSVPRLRGRGEQRGYRDEETPFRQSSIGEVCLFTQPRAQLNAGVSPTVSLAHHGLAIEARSTPCALCSRACASADVHAHARPRGSFQVPYKAQVVLPCLTVFNARCSVFGLKLVSNLPTARRSKRK
jgi:hypothetical protein